MVLVLHNSYATPRWWKEAVVYQVYPASFQSDASASTPGWGTLRGLTSRLDYLKALGADVVWSSPILRSPQADMGYDIADYKAIDARYGTLADADELIAQLRARGMALMMDLVVNHTSSEHAWFRESRASRHSPKRDWYIWKPPRRVGADGVPEPPNNWAQILGEANSAWHYDEPTGEFYLGLFTPEQPDLNWENPEVRAAVWDVMHFWMQRGASGFRMDVINLISKDPAFPDAKVTLPGQKYQPGTAHYANGPRLHEYLGEMHRAVLARYDETITVGEMPGVSDAREVLRTVGAHAQELRMIFIFDLVDIDKPAGGVRMSLKPWDVKEMKATVARWQRVMIEGDGWNSVFVENHDNPRSVSRYADDGDAWRARGATLLALLQTTLGGTLFVYQGEEIGMRNIPVGAGSGWDVERDFKDVETVNYWRKSRALYGGGRDPERLDHARAVVAAKARDHARTPMQWTGAAGETNAGFCEPGVRPWMRVMDDYATVNVEAQMRDDDDDDDDDADHGGDSGNLSVWRFWQRALRDRKEHKDVFVYGDFEELTHEHPQVFAYVRTSTASKGERWVVVLNFSGRHVEWDLPDGFQVEAWPRGNYAKGPVGKPRTGMVPLKPWEGVLGKLVVGSG